MRGCSRGACLVAWGDGGHACVVAPGGHAWFYLGGHAWFYSGGMHGFSGGSMCGFIQGQACMVLFGGACMVLFGGMHGFIRGACVVLFGGCVVFPGGMCVFFGFFRYNEIRSMSGRYASYWNAFLLPLSLSWQVTASAFFIFQYIFYYKVL